MKLVVDLIAETIRNDTRGAGAHAEAIMEDLDRAGYVIVPKEATNAQVISGLETSLKIMTEAGVDALSPFKDYPAPTEITRRVYREMVKAVEL